MSQVTINATNNNADGQVTAQNAVFATARNASNGNSSSTTIDTTFAYIAAGTYFISRGFTTFSLSSVPKGSQIQAVSIKILGVGKQNIDSDSIFICQGSQSSSLGTSDFPNVTFTSLGSVALSAVTDNQYSTISLNSTGVSLIKNNLGGTVKIAFVMGRDFNNTAPSGQANEWDIQGAKSGNPPQLVVTYTLGGSSLIAQI